MYVVVIALSSLIVVVVYTEHAGQSLVHYCTSTFMATVISALPGQDCNSLASSQEG